MRKRILLLVAALMMALTMAFGSVAAFAQNAKECREAGGTYNSSTKTCAYPVGNSGKVKTETQENAGQGDQTGRTGPNGQSLPF